MSKNWADQVSQGNSMRNGGIKLTRVALMSPSCHERVTVNVSPID
jgi:hypothetical protein